MDERANHTVVDPDGLRWRARAAGRGAAYLEAEATPSPELTLRLALRREALWATRPRSLYDLVPAYGGLLAEFRAGSDREEVLRWLRAAPSEGSHGVEPRHHELTVRYGHHADRAALERATGLPWQALVDAHAGAIYTVAFIGFTPGFPYLHGLSEALAVPRRERPERRVPAGAIAIADGQAGIYPADSPGGWWVLGTTEARLFDPTRAPPALLAGGDTLRFVPAPGDAPSLAQRDDDAPLDADDAFLGIDEAWPGALALQAAPRWGVAQHGMAQSGALDPLAFEAAQEIVGAPRRTAALEVLVPRLRCTLERAATIVVTGGGARLFLDGSEAATWRAHTLAPGSQLELRPAHEGSGATSVLAVAGGFRWPWIEGVHPELARVPSSDVRAGIGRALRAGDRLALAGPADTPRPWIGRPRYGGRAYLRVDPGPQATPASLETLIATSWRVEARDRTGARLDGPPLRLERHDVRSQGVPRGAVQVAGDGRPMVLLADRGRTGGYAVPAVVDPRDLWQLAQAGPGTEVWFVPSRARH